LNEAETTEAIKQKLLAMLHVAASDGAKPEDWEIYFGEGSIMNSLITVNKIKVPSMPDDDSINVRQHREMTVEEMLVLQEWMREQLVKKGVIPDGL
jgi:hypothetical protein